MNEQIPAEVQEFAKELAILCGKYKLHHFQGNYLAGIQTKWHNIINFSWDSGRHNADIGRITLTSTLDLTVRIGEED